MIVGLWFKLIQFMLSRVIVIALVRIKTQVPNQMICCKIVL